MVTCSPGVQKRIDKILNRTDINIALKIRKLQVFALKLFASSPNQLHVIATYQRLQKEGTK